MTAQPFLPQPSLPLFFALLSGHQVIIRNIRIINANQDGQNAIVLAQTGRVRKLNTPEKYAEIGRLTPLQG
jgi:hypothetical protein